MKKSVLIVINILLVVAMALLLIIQSSAKTDIAKGFDGKSINSSFLDNTGLVENPDGITDLVRKTSEELEMNIFVYVAGTSDSYRSDYDIECFADDFYDEIYGEDTDGIFYYMDLSGRSPAYDYISTSGKAVLLYQKNIDNIFSRLDNYLPASGQTVYPENVENATEEFLRAIKDYGKTSGLNSMIYYHDKSSGKYMFMKNGEFVVSTHKPVIYNIILLVVCIVIGLIVAVTVYSATKCRYRFKKSQNSGIYVRNDKTVFHRSTDTFIRTYTTKHKIETSSSGSRSGGGGHSHSGGHGGGGHHR